MIERDIQKFADQFRFVPEVANGPAPAGPRFVICGMGGSHLGADLLAPFFSLSGISITVHRDYGIPEQTDPDRVYIISSYSGNTEEAIDAYTAARARGARVLVIAAGGALFTMAEKDAVPFIKLPTGLQPRMALGYSAMAMAQAAGATELVRQLGLLSTQLVSADFQKWGSELAAQITGSIPVIYTSMRNQALGYFWKIMLNETGKIPAFVSVLPEANHNEMNGFDINSFQSSASPFRFIFIRDDVDDFRVIRRMDVLARLYRERRYEVFDARIESSDNLVKIFSSVLLAMWVAYHTALLLQRDPEQVPLVEEFKKLIAE